MRNEDIVKKVIRPLDKDYYQTIDVLGKRIQRMLDRERFHRYDKEKNAVIIWNLIGDLLAKYEEKGLFERCSYSVVAAQNGTYVGMVVVHLKHYFTFSAHHFYIHGQNKKFVWC